MPQGSSGEWHTGEVVSLCDSYGFIRISKDRKSDDIFMHYDDVSFEPQIGDHVSFELATDARFPDRQKAVADSRSSTRDGRALRLMRPPPRATAPRPTSMPRPVPRRPRPTRS